MCEVLEVSTSGYYDWLKRKESKRKQYHRFLISWIVQIHAEPDVFRNSKLTVSRISLSSNLNLLLQFF
ncbi:MAG: hypothetical protein IPO06_06685 [Leptospiraceae bacterium]|nr:hypothetical protein [Leptospiraceae bacterium]